MGASMGDVVGAVREPAAGDAARPGPACRGTDDVAPTEPPGAGNGNPRAPVQTRDISEDVVAQLEQSLEHERTLSGILNELQGCSGSGHVLQVLIDRLTSISWLGLPARATGFLVEGDRLRLVACRNIDPEQQQTCATVPFGHCVCGRVAASGQRVIETHADAGSHGGVMPEVPHGHVAFPMVHGEENLGVVTLFLPPGVAPDQRQVAFLEAAVAAATGALRTWLAIERETRARDRLTATQRLESLGRLARGISHDFNNMLAVISGLADLIDERVEPGGPAAADVEEIRRTVASAQRLTRQLVHVGRDVPGNHVLLDPNEVISNALRFLRRSVGDHVRVRAELAAEVGAVVADPVHLEQILLNLALNARDAMPDGGDIVIRSARMTISAAEAGLLVPCAPGPYVVTSISDTGGGIPASVRSHLFDPYVTTKAHRHGSGLGLAIVHSLVVGARGSIRVSDVPGGGTMFEVLLPAHGDGPADVDGRAPI